MTKRGKDNGGGGTPGDSPMSPAASRSTAVTALPGLPAVPGGASLRDLGDAIVACLPAGGAPVDPARVYNLLAGGGCLSHQDVRGRTLRVSGLLAHRVVLDGLDGEPADATRVVLVCSDGTAVQYFSSGVLRGLDLLISLAGPPPWDPPIPLRVEEASTAGGRRYYYLVWVYGEGDK